MKKLIIIPLLLLPLSLNAPPLSFWSAFEAKHRAIAAYEAMLYQRELDRYAQHLGYKESSNNWKAINKHGYMGTWQHGSRILADLGLDIKPEAFRADSSIFPPELQYKALMAQIKAHTIQLSKYEEWLGHEIGGIVITRAGLLAGAHLGGLGAVRDYIHSGGLIDKRDSNGTRLSDYIREFSIYNL